MIRYTQKLIKDMIRFYINRGVVVRQHSHSDSFKLNEMPNGYFRSFGTKNPDKIFYVIWCKNMGSGFFSNISHVLCHIKIAIDSGMIPVVDFKNFKTLYNEEKTINSTENAWEYYFNPVSPYNLDEVYESKNVFFCNGYYPSFMSCSITQVPELFDTVFNKYISLNDHVKKIYLYRKSKYLNRVLGIHFRGQEQKIAPSHSFPPTEYQMIKYTNNILSEYNINKIFIVTEEQRYLDLYVKNFNNNVLYNNSFRTYQKNAYNIIPRDDHRYKLGLEVLLDALYLSDCSGLLCGDSNVSEFARFNNNNKYEFVYKIYNGVNSQNALLARHLYRIKKHLPPHFGGLADKICKQ